MDARELRMGNLLERDDEVFAASAYTILLVERGDIECKPIPLTEKWLLDFGFEIADDLGDMRFFELPEVTKSGYGFGICHDHDEWSFYLTRNNVINTLVYDEHFFQHVHALQNLYWCLTGQELTLKTK